MSVTQFAESLLSYCHHLNASVTSWYRTPQNNERRWGARESSHTYGLGADVEYDLPVAFDIAVNLAEFLGLKLIREKDHDHLEPLDWHIPAVRR